MYLSFHVNSFTFDTEPTLFILRRVNSIQERSKVFLRSLSTADLGVGIFLAFPMTVSSLSGDWLLGDLLCKTQAIASLFVMYISYLSLFLLTVDRYIAVVYALRYPSLVTVKRARIAVCCVWGLGALMGIAGGALTDWKVVHTRSLLACIIYNNEVPEFIPIQLIYVCLALTCLLSVLLAYIRLFMISCHHARRIHADNQVGVDGNQPVRPSKKSSHTLLILVSSAFFCSVMPLFCQLLRLYNRIIMLVMLILPILANSWLNVIIYYLRNADICRETLAVLISHFLNSIYIHFNRTKIHKLCSTAGFLSLWLNPNA